MKRKRIRGKTADGPVAMDEAAKLFKVEPSNQDWALADAGAGEAGPILQSLRRTKRVKNAITGKWKEVPDWSRLEQKLKRDRVPLSLVVPTEPEQRERSIQRYLNPAAESEGLEGGLGKARPLLFKYGGKYLIWDGHHRVEAARRKGEADIDADVLDFAEVKLAQSGLRKIGFRHFPRDKDPEGPTGLQDLFTHSKVRGYAPVTALVDPQKQDIYLGSVNDTHATLDSRLISAGVNLPRAVRVEFNRGALEGDPHRVEILVMNVRGEAAPITVGEIRATIRALLAAGVPGETEVFVPAIGLRYVPLSQAAAAASAAKEIKVAQNWLEKRLVFRDLYPYKPEHLFKPLEERGGATGNPALVDLTSNEINVGGGEVWHDELVSQMKEAQRNLKRGILVEFDEWSGEPTIDILVRASVYAGEDTGPMAHADARAAVRVLLAAGLPGEAHTRVPEFGVSGKLGDIPALLTAHEMSWRKAAGAWLRKWGKTKAPKQRIPRDIREKTYYHGVDDSELAEQIAAEGKLDPRRPSNYDEWNKPVRGRVYVAQDKKLADTYAEGQLGPGEHGRVFEVSGRDFHNIQPDEDDVAALAADLYNGTIAEPKWLLDLADKFLTEQEKENLYLQEGRKLVRRMTDKQKFDLIRNYGASIAHAGPLPVRAHYPSALNPEEEKAAQARLRKIAVIPLKLTLQSEEPASAWDRYDREEAEDQVGEWLGFPVTITESGIIIRGTDRNGAYLGHVEMRRERPVAVIGERALPRRVEVVEPPESTTPANVEEDEAGDTAFYYAARAWLRKRFGPLGQKLMALRGEMAAAAQKVYDDWAQDEEGNDFEYGCGGICDNIAEAIGDVASSKTGANATTQNSEGMGENHTWAIVWDDDEAYEVDIAPGNYETGGGYAWKKRLGVEFTAGIVGMGLIDRDQLVEAGIADPVEPENEEGEEEGKLAKVGSSAEEGREPKERGAVAAWGRAVIARNKADALQALERLFRGQTWGARRPIELLIETGNWEAAQWAVWKFLSGGEDIEEAARAWLRKKIVSPEERAWQGRMAEGQTSASREERTLQGRLGEELAARALAETRGGTYESLNLPGAKPAPLDLIGGGMGIEVKTGSAARLKGAWNVTTGTLTTREREALGGMNPEERHEYWERRKALALQRKNQLLKKLSAKLGQEVTGVTVGVILNPEGTAGDVYLVPGFHPTMAWRKYAVDANYLGTFSFGAEQ